MRKQTDPSRAEKRSSAVATIALVVKTVFEDRTLQAELPGCNDYVRKVRYRLLPGFGEGAVILSMAFLPGKNKQAG